LQLKAAQQTRARFGPRGTFAAMSFFKRMIGRKSDERGGEEAATGLISSLPKDPFSPAKVSTHFADDLATSGASSKAKPQARQPSEPDGEPPVETVPPEMAPEVHDASGLLEEDENDTVDQLREHEPARVTSSFSKEDHDLPYNQVGYSWANTNSWRSDTGMVDYGGKGDSPGAGSKGAPGDPNFTNSFKSHGSFGSDVTDYDYMMAPGAQAEMSPEYRAAVFGNHPGVQHGMMSGYGHPGNPGGMPMPHMPHGYPPHCFPGVWPGFGPYMDPAMMAAAAASGGSMPTAGFPQASGGHLSAEDMDAAAEKMMMTARMMQAAAAAQRQQQTTNSRAIPSGGSGSRRGNVAFASGAGAALSSGPPASASGSSAPVASSDCNVELSQRTTVMLRNIPNDYSRDMLLDLLNQEAFRGCYDFVYLPQDFKRHAGLGYAFINLVDHAEAMRFMQHFGGFNSWKFSSQKVCEAAWGAPLQGLEQHIYRYKNSPLMHPDVPDEFKPVLFKDGVRIVFPDPTKRIRPPRMKLSVAGGGVGGAAPGLEMAAEDDEA